MRAVGFHTSKNCIEYQIHFLYPLELDYCTINDIAIRQLNHNLDEIKLKWIVAAGVKIKIQDIQQENKEYVLLFSSNGESAL